MSICLLQEILDFCGVENEYIIVNAGNSTIYCKYSGGASTAVSISDGTYTPTELATAFQAGINTAFTISGTCTFSSTTRKFTIGTGNSNTIQYIAASSTAGLLLGFSENSSAATSIVSDQTTSSSDSTAVLATIQEGVESWVQNYCHRSFSETSYSEQYDTYNSRHESGGYLLTLKNYPITAITRVAAGTQDAVTIKNTNTYTTAVISISTTGITLIKDGVSDTTIIFSSYATLGTVVNAINALGNGWVATLASSDYSSYLSSELIKSYGRSCINNNNIYLQIPYEASSDFEVDADKGQIYFPYGLASGKFYLRIDYSAGYDIIPSDLSMCIKILIQSIWQKREETSFPLASYRLGELTEQMWKDNYGIPPEVFGILNLHKRILI